MNWYKISQQYLPKDELEKLKLLQEEVEIIFKLINSKYKKSLNYDIDDEKRKEINSEIRDLNSKKMQKQLQIYEISENLKKKANELIISGESYMVPPILFLNYHQTGNIRSDVYESYSTKEGLNWFRKHEYSDIVKKKKYKNHIIEFRKKPQTEKNREFVVKTDSDGEIVRDENGYAVYMDEEEMLKNGRPLYDTSIIAVDEQNDVIGFASDEFGTDGVWVIKDYQGLGIGTDLLEIFRNQFTDKRRIGQMTRAGENMTLSYHKRLVERALEQGKNVPDYVLDYYPDLKNKYKISSLNKKIFKKSIKLNEIYTEEELDDPSEYKYNYISKDDLSRDFSIKVMTPDEAKKYTVATSNEFVYDIYKSYATRDQRELVKYKIKNFDFDRVVLTINKTLLDGYHHVVAGIISNKPIKYIDLAEKNNELV